MAVYTGTESDDDHTGTSGNDGISGGGGDDTLSGAGGDDEIDGGHGSDSLYGGVGNDVISGGDGVDAATVIDSDSLFGGAGDDTLHGGVGPDALYGGAGNDTLQSNGFPNQEMDGGTGIDTVTFGFGHNGTTIDLAEGLASNGSTVYVVLSNIENVVGSAQDETLRGDHLNNVLDGGGGTDVISGNAGDDRIRDWDGVNSETFQGGDGNDTLDMTGGPSLHLTVSLAGQSVTTTDVAESTTLVHIEHVELGGGNDTIEGDSVANNLYGGGGDDIISGGGAADGLYGGEGSDIIGFQGDEGATGEGGAGTDTLRTTTSFFPTVTVDLQAGTIVETASGALMSWSGFENYAGLGNGDERVLGTAGANTIAAGSGANVLDGRGGADNIYGGFGDDRIVDGDGLNGDFLDGNSGIDTVDYSAVNLGAGTTFDLQGGSVSKASAFDMLSFVENVIGSQGGETILGTNAANVLNGGAGADVIDGRTGSDVIVGGLGNDTVVWTVIGEADTRSADGGAGVDTIRVGEAGLHPGDEFDLAAGTYRRPNFATFDESWTGFENYDGAAASTFETVRGTDGRNVIRTGSGDNSLYGRGGDDLLQGGAGTDLIDGGAGVDTASYSEATLGVTADLSRAGNQETVGAGSDILIRIENLVGSVQDDVLGGNGAANRLEGGGGLDTLRGWGGADVLVGGLGPDELEGGSGDDGLYGGTDGDTLDGGSGNDVLEGGAGDDQIDGGVGIDRVSYATATAAVTVDMAFLQNNTGGAGVDTLSNVENLTGSALADSFRGDGHNNALDGGGGADALLGGAGHDTLTGGAGNDVLDGEAGDDRMFGGLGVDTASYAWVSGAVTVSLATTAAQNTGEWGGVDSLSGIENLTGSFAGDRLTGNGGANRILGDWGNDFLKGGGGNDRLEGGLDGDDLRGEVGNDSLFGGDGTDVLEGGSGNDIVNGGNGSDTATYFNAAAAVTVSLATALAQLTGGAGRDTLSGVENLNGSNGFGDRLTGGTGANEINGYGGADVIRGGGGGDLLRGGAGADTFVYGALSDSTTAERDLIADYATGDKLDLSLIDANGGAAGDGAFTRIAAGAAFTAAGQMRLVYDISLEFTRVELNTDGDTGIEGLIYLAGNHTAATAEDGWVL